MRALNAEENAVSSLERSSSTRSSLATVRRALSASTRSLSTGALIGLITGLLAAGLLASPAGRYIEQDLGLSWLFRARGATAAPEDVMVVGIDRNTGRELGLASPETRDWPRQIHAKLIDTLVAGGAKLIVFDVLFEKEKAEEDAQFAAGIKRAGNVILAVDIDRRDLGGGLLLESAAQLSPAIADAAMGVGAVPLDDAEIRKDSFWTFVATLAEAPSLPAVVLQADSLEVYDELYRLASELRPALVTQWPKDRREASVNKWVQTLPEWLRDAGKEDRPLIAELRAALADDGNSKLDANRRRLLRNLLDAATGAERRYLNPYGPRRAITRVSYRDALTANGNGRFRNKIVFVGFSAMDTADNNFARDCHPTVYPEPDGVKVCGVELVATAFANLRQGSTLRQFANFTNLLIVIGMGLLAGLASLAWGAAISSLLVLGLAVSYWAVAYHQFVVANRWLPVVIPTLLAPLAALFVATWMRFIRAERQRARIREALVSFIPSRVADAILNQVPATTPYQQLVFGACLATDAQHYASVAEVMHPTELATLVQDYSRALFTTVQQHGGIVCGEAGDSMIGIWASQADDARLRAHACAAVLAISQTVEEFNRTSGRPALPTRFGLHAGEFVLGVIGTQEHLDFRAVGDIVNTAARIEGINKELGTRLLVSEEAIRDLDGFLFRRLGRFNVKSRVQPVAVCELICKKKDATSDQALLCDLFALALKRYEEARWQEATDAFHVLLREFPDDGPAQYYLNRCLEKT